MKSLAALLLLFTSSAFAENEQTIALDLEKQAITFVGSSAKELYSLLPELPATENTTASTSRRARRGFANGTHGIKGQVECEFSGQSSTIGSYTCQLINPTNETNKKIFDLLKDTGDKTRRSLGNLFCDVDAGDTVCTVHGPTDDTIPSHRCVVLLAESREVNSPVQICSYEMGSGATKLAKQVETTTKDLKRKKFRMFRTLCKEVVGSGHPPACPTEYPITPGASTNGDSSGQGTR